MQRHYYGFGPFRLHPDSRTLWKDGSEVDQPTDTEFRILITIICGKMPEPGVRLEPAHRPIAPRSLIAEVWPNNRSKEESNLAKLATHIKNLRGKLGNTDEGISYIRNSRDDGYYLAVPVKLVIEKSNVALRWLATFVAACTILGVFLVRPNQASVVQFVQLTNDGWQKSGPILTGGRRLFFEEQRQSTGRIVSIPIEGGEPVPLSGLAGAITLQDISPNGQNLLFLRGDDKGEHSAWLYSLQNASAELIGHGIDAAAWRDDNAISLARRNSLFIRDIRSQRETKLLESPGSPGGLKWSPDGKTLRCSIGGGAHEGVFLWQLARDAHRLQHLQGGQKYAYAGSWSRDRQHFFYDAGDDSRKDIWVESLYGINAFTHSPLRLTNGPGSWSSPEASSDGSRLFALHGEHRTALVRFNLEKNEWEDMWDGSPVLELEYSPDKQWVVFVHQPDYTIWKSRPDGSGRIRLTSARLTARQPHWSRDGQEIAFMGQNSKGAYRIFVVRADRGAAEELQPDGPDQGVPTWSPDDSNVLFGERMDRRKLSEMCLHTLNIRTREIKALNGTNGLWSPRWSPDRKSILAVTSDSRTIRILPVGKSHWSDIAAMAFVENVTWSYDSRYIYFDGRLRGLSPFALYRVGVADRSVETLVDLKEFAIPGENWWGITPDGSLLGSKEYVSEEIYELRCKLP